MVKGRLNNVRKKTASSMAATREEEPSVALEWNPQCRRETCAVTHRVLSMRKAKAKAKGTLVQIKMNSD